MSNLTFYFKSGNKVTIDKVTEWKVKAEYLDIDAISIHQDEPRNKMIVKSLDLRSIECIIEHD